MFGRRCGGLVTTAKGLSGRLVIEIGVGEVANTARRRRCGEAAEAPPQPRVAGGR